MKDFSGKTAPRILKLSTQVGYDLLFCVKQNQSPAAYHSLDLSIFLSLQSNFLSLISRLLRGPEPLNVVYAFRVDMYIVGKKTKVLRLVSPSFFIFLSLIPL